MNPKSNKENLNENLIQSLTCSHSSISVNKDHLLCNSCNREFRNGELGAIRKERESKCEHKRLSHGYASNPPQSLCLDCGRYFKSK
jgi:hypothetical protein